ncbi:MAG: hypothetical protein KJ061_15120 [Vicinamibacteraceae bacterium]|nr:hypothetical protein [Vicinamibacteraceae bacterium]
MTRSSIGSAFVRIVVPYAVFAGTWILVSDRVLAELSLDPGARTEWSIVKGLGFILVTALLLTALLARELRMRARAQTALEASEAELRRLHATLQQHAADLERRVAERTSELAEARDRAEIANRMKSAFLSTMSHELRSPLNSIIGFADVLLQGLAGPLNEEQTAQLRIVKDSGCHLLGVINEVLDISKIEAGQIELALSIFDVREPIEKAVRSLEPQAARKQVELEVRVLPGAGEITSDRRRLEQVLLNLVGNAIKFTERGRVTVTAEPSPAPASAAAQHTGLRICVADTGCGIHPDDMRKLFKPFTQVGDPAQRHDGTGLGLAISKRIVERLGGTIEVTSQPDRGSTFTVTLPFDPPL